MHTTFLLGSGVSIDAGFPSVRRITEQVVAGAGVWRHTDSTYVINADSPAAVTCRSKVESVLRLIGDVFQQMRASMRDIEPTYEHCALVLRQVHDALSGEYESPAVLPFAEQLAVQADVTSSDLIELCEEALHYIDDTVVQMLRRGRPDDYAHLAAILELCRKHGRVDLATLNHDLLLEAALNATGIAYADGFERSAEDVQLWTDQWHARVRLLKLHGSIDWFDVRNSADPAAEWIAARYVGRDVQHFERPGFQLRSQRPRFLTGTFTKILEYQSGIFLDVHTRFHEGLRDAARVVIIGYGFGDKAINSHLIRWMSRDTANRLVICHARPDDAFARARPAIRRAIDAWASARRVLLIPVFVAELTYDALHRCCSA